MGGRVDHCYCIVFVDKLLYYRNASLDPPWESDKNPSGGRKGGGLSAVDLHPVVV